MQKISNNSWNALNWRQRDIFISTDTKHAQFVNNIFQNEGCFRPFHSWSSDLPEPWQEVCAGEGVFGGGGGMSAILLLFIHSS